MMGTKEHYQQLFFGKKTRSGISVNEQIAKEWKKTVIKKVKRRKVY